MCLGAEALNRLMDRADERAQAVATDPRGGICEYAYNGCPGAKDGKKFKRYCENDGEYCPDKFVRAMEEK